MPEAVFFAISTIFVRGPPRFRTASLIRVGVSDKPLYQSASHVATSSKRKWDQTKERSLYRNVSKGMFLLLYTAMVH